MKEEMKGQIEKLNTKVTILIVLVVISLILNILILGGGRSSTPTTTNSEEETQYNEDYDVSDFKEIEAKDIASLSKNDIHVIYIGRSTCSWCAAMLPTLKEAQKNYKYTTNYIDLAKIIDPTTWKVIDNNAYTILSELDAVEAEKNVMSELGSTPMMLIINNNIIVASQVGYSDYDTFAKVLEKGGLKK
ncbi:MAG: hypothetical protein J1F35_03920 [Erysipelotrichales bacterium]|nr:hypothetical protein [Erysipelotrichales bacterium]